MQEVGRLARADVAAVVTASLAAFISLVNVVLTARLEGKLRLQQWRLRRQNPSPCESLVSPVKPWIRGTGRLSSDRTWFTSVMIRLGRPKSSSSRMSSPASQRRRHGPPLAARGLHSQELACTRTDSTGTPAKCGLGIRQGGQAAGERPNRADSYRPGHSLTSPGRAGRVAAQVRYSRP